MTKQADIMVATADPTSEALERLEERILEAGNAITAHKLKQLQEKWDNGMTAIAFCGHFSAGKSTLINRLCGRSLLPSSPIPTSANLVSIRSGEPGAEVTRRLQTKTEKLGTAGEIVRVTERIPLDELDAYCVNGTDIESVRITYPLPLLGEQGMLLDTPGIDSTDDAHQLATESAMHMADVVLYVMDYNHVQSEINFAFAKKMRDWGKPLYFIINMIDKHREQELSFEAYRASAEQAFRSWHIEPAGMLFVTTKEPNHPHNEWRKLRALVGALLSHGPELQSYSLDRSVRFLLKEHGTWLSAQHEQERASLQEKLDAEGAAAGETLQQYEAKQDELEKVRGEAEELLALLRKELTAIVENANITPAPTRDLAHEYLQSRKPGFKVGLFGAAAKTAAERARRLELFRSDFAEQIETQLDWHVKDTLKKAAEAHGLKSDELIGEIDALGFSANEDWLAGQVSEAAGFGGDYTLNYCRQIAAEVKAHYRKQSFLCAQRITETVARGGAERAVQLETELEELSEKLTAWHELRKLEEQERKELALVAAKWPASEASVPRLPGPAELAPAGDEPDAAAGGLPAGTSALGSAVSMRTILDASHSVKAAAAAGSQDAPTASAAASAWSGADYRRKLDASAARLEQAAQLVRPIAAMKSLAGSMQDKAARLRGGTFTIALFGAFSAGKSSFANALIGQRVLPVSPNPTTAAINKIVPPAADWPHGTARVRMKQLAAIEQDVLFSLDVLGEPASDLEDALQHIRKLSPADIGAKGKPHYSFLRAVESGFARAKPLLGEDVRITLGEFASYVADETRSCFVEDIELHHANPLTEQGIVFVDTPGADSINARHTGVAFDYIKNADAILFVTYYNHAFSQADREFLLQLGRVKDSFELDKMFFIVNAADLAGSDEELAGVVAHVEANLLQHGIRRPRIYPVSSQLAADAKLAGSDDLLESSGIAAFERDFIRFGMSELSSIAVHSAERELTRAVHTLERWIAGAQEGEAQRQSRLEHLEQAYAAALTELRGSGFEEERKELAREIRELLYYVKQRTSYRFGELYNAAFNPSSFREESRDVKNALRGAWRELERMIAFDLSQEALATTLRVENAINASASKRYAAWSERIAEKLDGFEAEPYEAKRFPTPEPAEETLNAVVSDKLLSSHFKNAKQFFEGSGKSRLRAELEGFIGEPMSHWIERETQRLTAAYEGQLEAWLQEQLAKLEDALHEHAEGLRDALKMKVNVSELLRLKEQMIELLPA